MSILFIFFGVIVIIIVIARLASKTRPPGERVEPKGSGLYTIKKIKPQAGDQDLSDRLKALTALLVQKGVITEGELEKKQISNKEETI